MNCKVRIIYDGACMYEGFNLSIRDEDLPISLVKVFVKMYFSFK